MNLPGWPNMEHADLFLSLSRQTEHSSSAAPVLESPFPPTRFLAFERSLQTIHIALNAQS